MDIQELANQICNQADRLFPDRTDSSMFLKMYGELGELISAETPEKRAKEFADVMIMLLDYAAGHHIPITKVITDKMSINESRTWTVNGLGVFQHVAD